MPLLTFDTYGKTNIRLTQVIREGSRHEITEISVNILFRGEFEKAFTDADNSQILPTDTMKNTVYALARLHPITSIENFGQRLARHFLDRVASLQQVQIGLIQTLWNRIGHHESAFVLGGQERRVTTVTVNRNSMSICSGMLGLELIKTENSAFSGFLKDDLTTLAETRDRLLGTVLDASWTYRSENVGYDEIYKKIVGQLLETFASHASESVQHTLFAMASSALRSCPELVEVHLKMPNKHRLVVDLSRFGLDNPNQIFVSTSEPAGYIEARVTSEQN